MKMWAFGKSMKKKLAKFTKIKIHDIELLYNVATFIKLNAMILQLKLNQCMLYKQSKKRAKFKIHIKCAVSNDY